MAILRNSVAHTLAALLALLVFGGDVLDDVWDVSVPAAAMGDAHSSSQHDSDTTKCCQHDTAALMGAVAFVSPELPSVFFYSDIDEVASPGAPPAIDHPPQRV